MLYAQGISSIFILHLIVRCKEGKEQQSRILNNHNFQTYSAVLGVIFNIFLETHSLFFNVLITLFFCSHFMMLRLFFLQNYFKSLHYVHTDTLFFFFFECITIVSPLLPHTHHGQYMGSLGSVGVPPTPNKHMFLGSLKTLF